MFENIGHDDQPMEGYPIFSQSHLDHQPARVVFSESDGWMDIARVKRLGAPLNGM